MKQIKPCKHCGMAGWLERRVHSYVQFFNPDGKPSHASDGDCLGRGGKRKYCCDCGRDITSHIQEEQ